MKKPLILNIFISFIFSVSLISCGSESDDSGSNRAKTLKGTAATGTAIVGTVKITGSQGNDISVLIDSAGNYTAQVESLTPPFILSAIPSDSSLETQYSYASAANTQVNITPLTSLVLFLANSKNDLPTLELAWNNQSNTFNQATIDALKLTVNANFQTLLSAAGIDPAAFDIFSSSFNTDSTGFNGVLDSLTLTIDDNTDSFSMTVSGEPVFSFDENINNASNLGSLALTGTGTTLLEINTYSPNEVSNSPLTVGNLTITTIIWTITDSGTTYTLAISKTTGSENSLVVGFDAKTGEVETIWANNSVSADNLILSESSVEFINLTLSGQVLPLTLLSLTGTLDL